MSVKWLLAFFFVFVLLILMLLKVPVIVVSVSELSVQKQSCSWADGLLYYHCFYYFDGAFTGALQPNPTFPRGAGLEEISAAVLLSVCLLHVWQIHFDGSYSTICPEQLQAGTG